MMRLPGTWSLLSNNTSALMRASICWCAFRAAFIVGSLTALVSVATTITASHFADAFNAEDKSLISVIFGKAMETSFIVG